MKRRPRCFEPWTARPSTDPGSKAWVVWGHFTENAVTVSSLVTGEPVPMPPERPLFKIESADGINPELIAWRIVKAVNESREEFHSL